MHGIFKDGEEVKPALSVFLPANFREVIARKLVPKDIPDNARAEMRQLQMADLGPRFNRL